MTLAPDRFDGRHVALVFSSLQGGGIQRVMLTLARGFIDRGVRVDLLIVDPRGDLRPSVPDAARIVDLGGRGAARSLPALTRYLRRARPDAVLASQTHLNLVVLLARALARVPCRVVATEHVALDAVLANAATWRERLFPAGARLGYRHADAVVAVSHDTANRFCAATGLARDTVSVIYNPVVTPDLFVQARARVDHPWFAAAAPPVILSAGRLTHQKDHTTLLRAFARLRQTLAARLVILGEGEERQALEQLAGTLGVRADVQLPGFVVNPFAYMARARVFALSSRWEGCPNVLIEAMACGVPVVSTDCPSGPAEVLQGGTYGRLVPVGDETAMAEAMLHTLHETTDPPPRVARAGTFSAEHAVSRYLEVLLPCG